MDSPPVEAAAAASESLSLNVPSFDDFRASAHRQTFSLPEPIVHYIAKNPYDPEVYQKLIKSCKYFFIKQPLLVFHCLHYNDEDGWKTCIDGETCQGPQEQRKYKKIDLDLDKIQSKIWLIWELDISSAKKTIASSLISKMYYSDIVLLQLFNQNLSFYDFLFLSGEVAGCFLGKCTVADEYGEEVPVDIIVESLPDIEWFKCIPHKNPRKDFSNTAANLLKIPHFKNIELAVFCGFNESFDIDKFYDYLKENKKSYFALNFHGHLSDEYKDKLQMLVDKNFDAGRTFKPFYLEFRGQLRRQEIYKFFEKELYESYLAPKEPLPSQTRVIIKEILNTLSVNFLYSTFSGLW